MSNKIIKYLSFQLAILLLFIELYVGFMINLNLLQKIPILTTISGIVLLIIVLNLPINQYWLFLIFNTIILISIDFMIIIYFLDNFIQGNSSSKEADQLYVIYVICLCIISLLIFSLTLMLYTKYIRLLEKLQKRKYYNSYINFSYEKLDKKYNNEENIPLITSV